MEGLTVKMKWNTKDGYIELNSEGLKVDGLQARKALCSSYKHLRKWRIPESQALRVQIEFFTNVFGQAIESEL